MINATSLASPAVQCAIAGAMRYAVAAGANPELFSRDTGKYEVQRHGEGKGRVYIKNRKGHNFMRVDYRRGEGFTFYASACSNHPGFDCTKAVIQSLRA